MTKIIITSWNGSNRVTGETRVEDAEAVAKLATIQQTDPDAFIVDIHPGGGSQDWLVDPVAKTISFDPLPPPPNPTVISYGAFESRFTALELDAITNYVYEIDPLTSKPKRVQVIQAYNRAVANDRVDLQSATTISFMDGLVTAGIIDAARKTVLLTP